MNIGICKIGKSISFSPTKWGLVGGDSAPSILFTSLASINSDINFYIIGKSDFSKLSDIEKSKINPNKNIVDCWCESAQTDANDVFNTPLNFIKKNNIQLDAVIVMSGMCGVVNMNDKIWSVNTPNTYAKTLYQFQHYVGPIIHFLNETQVPMFTISEDPRHIRLNAKDLFNRERFCLSQENSTQKVNHIRSYDDQTIIKYNIPVKYSEIEKIFLIGETKKDTLSIKKDILITMFMNGHTMKANETRKPFIDEYIHSNFPETKVYGKWPNDIINNDSRYEAIRMGDIMDEVLRTKYTLVVSIKPGFITCKPFEMINFGIIPFLHPTYDKNNLLKFPKFLYVKDANDFKEKIKYLENNYDQYLKLRKYLQNLLKPEYYDGTYINNIIMTELFKLIGKNYVNKTIGTTVKISSFFNKNKNKQINKLF